MVSILLLCAVVIVICIVASRLSQRLGVPAERIVTPWERDRLLVWTAQRP